MSVLKTTINDISGNSCIVFFPQLTTVIENLKEKTDYNDIDEHEILFVFNNSRRTKLTCSFKEYEKFLQNYENYSQWVEKNPQIELSRFEMTLMTNLIKDTIDHGFIEALKTGDSIKSGFIELNESMQQSILASTSEKIDEINNTLIKLNKLAADLNVTAEKISYFTPNKITELNSINEIENDKIINELKL